MKIDTEQLIRNGGKHRTALFAALVLLGCLAALVTVCRGNFTNDVSRLFPDTRETRATFGIIHKSHLSDAVQLEFVCSGDVTKHAGYLEDAAARLESSPFVKRIAFRYRSDDLNAELENFSKLVPRFFTPAILDDCDPETAAKNAQKQLAAFPAPGAARRLRNQPFGFDRKILERLRKLDDATGMELDRTLPYFVTPDHRRAMIAVETNVRLGDADAVRQLFAELRRCAGTPPAGVEMRIISGCSHTLGNEEVLKRDAMIAGAVSLVLFVLLFLCFYRGDRRALWIPLLPLYASLISLAVMTFIFREICLYVIGLGGCITGLAVDQGIHVYSAFRGGDAEKRTAALAEPMLLSAATSIAVFVFLAFTGIDAYIQLAVFAGLALVFSAILALLVLPQLLDKQHQLRRIFSAPPAGRKRGRAFVAVIMLVAAALAVLPQLVKRADFALESLDGTPQKTLDEEKEFRAAWQSPGRADTAALAAGGKDGEAALEKLESVAAAVKSNGVSVSLPPRPSHKIQRANREKWRAPEVSGKLDDLEKRCREACRRRKLPEKFFDPFFVRLRAEIASDDLSLPPILEHIDRRMIKSHGESAAAVALLPDTLESAKTIRKVLRERGEEQAALLSRTGFKLLIREELGGRFEWLLPLSVAAALAMLFAVFRKGGDVILAMVPVAVAFSGVALLMYLTRFRPTPAAAFALVLLTGLAVDYGIYAVSQLRHPGEIDTRDPILLSAATTVAGAGALLTSRHPALFGTGVVLAPGIALACLCGIYLVPMLKRSAPPRKAGLLLLSAAALLVCGAGCGMSLWKNYPAKDETLRRMRLPYPDTEFKVRARVTASFRGRVLRFVLAAKIDPRSGDVTLAGVDPGSGALLFKHDGRPDSRPILGPILAADAPPQFLEFLKALPEDLRNIFVAKDEVPRTVGEDDDHISVFCENDCYWRLYRDGKRMERGCISGLFADWNAEYDDAGREVIYRRFGSMKCRKYALFLQIDEIRQVKK